jgi:hypothetical protein
MDKVTQERRRFGHYNRHRIIETALVNITGVHTLQVGYPVIFVTDVFSRLKMSNLTPSLRVFFRLGFIGDRLCGLVGIEVTIGGIRSVDHATPFIL